MSKRVRHSEEFPEDSAPEVNHTKAIAIGSLSIVVGGWFFLLVMSVLSVIVLFVGCIAYGIMTALLAL